MGNRRNSKMQKQLQISLGEVTVSTPRDRNVGYSVNVRVSNKWDYLFYLHNLIDSPIY